MPLKTEAIDTEAIDETGRAAIVRDLDSTMIDALGAVTFEEALHVLSPVEKFR